MAKPNYNEKKESEIELEKYQEVDPEEAEDIIELHPRKSADRK